MNGYFKNKALLLSILSISALVVAGVWATSTRTEEDPAARRQALIERLVQVEKQETLLSEVYEVDKIYPSMTGPWSSREIHLGDPAKDETVWVTGYRAVMVGDDGATAMPQDFMCHSNLDLDPAEHMEKTGAHPAFSPRLFTLSQGQFEIDLPSGFGIPVRSSEALDLTTQVLNLNHHDPEPVSVRHKVSLRYALDEDLGPGMVPLMPIAAYGLALTEGESGYFGVAEPDAEMHGPGCLVEASASDHAYEDPFGRTFSGHWQVPPGRQVNRTLVTQLMQVPFETTIHYIAVHLHPFAESLTLKNLTTGEVLFESRAENFDDRIGLAKVDAFSSAEGVPIHPDHEYELISVYDNTSGEMQDSMAVMYIYLRDVEMERRLGAGARS